MTNPRKKFETLRMPKYPGGKEAFREFITKNIKVPQAAAEANVAGSVIVGYDITDNGIVRNVHIIKGLGYGCDEESIRVISMLRYERVKNRGQRVTVHTKASIHFHQTKVGPAVTVVPDDGPEPKPSTTITYSITSTPPDPPASSPAPEKPKEDATYTYTINL